MSGCGRVEAEVNGRGQCSPESSPSGDRSFAGLVVTSGSFGSSDADRNGFARWVQKRWDEMDGQRADSKVGSLCRRVGDCKEKTRRGFRNYREGDEGKLIIIKEPSQRRR